MSRFLNIIVAVVIVIWAGFTTYTEIIDEDPDQYSIKSPAVKQQLENCNGTFQQRQACAERITTARQQLGFLVWCEKVAIILGPPLVLWGLTSWATRQARNQTPRPAPASRRTAAAAARPARRVMAADSPSREGSHGPEPTHDRSSDAPTITGGRREPVRRRDK